METATSQRFVESMLLSPDGEIIWRGGHTNRAECTQLIPGLASNTALLELLGVGQAEHSCRKDEVYKLAKSLGLVSSDGCVKGFLNVLPRGRLMHECVEAFNREHLAALNPARFDFPLVFDSKGLELSTLIAGYERQGRLFRIQGFNDSLRLSYAADPCLFSFIKDKRVIAANLPYAIYSPTPVFRCLQSGEVSGLDHLRQYDVPDLHILCLNAQGLEAYAHATRLAATGARFWLGEDFAQFIDIAEDVFLKIRELIPTMAKAAGQFTLVNVMKKRPRYYGLRTGIVAYAGFGNMMLYNLQWDDTNSDLFNIKTDSGDKILIIHATVAGGWPKVMPIVLGRSLSGLREKSLPVELAPEQVICVPIKPRHRETTSAMRLSMENLGVRVRMNTDFSKGLGNRIRQIRDSWEPFVMVVGDKEVDMNGAQLKQTIGGGTLSIEQFISQYGSRIERCHPATPIGRMDLPFDA